MSEDVEKLIKGLELTGGIFDYMLTPNDSELLLNYIKQLQKQNEDLKEYYNNMFECHCNRVQVENLQSNWHELEKFVEEDIKHWEEQEKEWIKLGFMNFGGESNTKHIFRRVLNKMQELEGNNE